MAVTFEQSAESQRLTKAFCENKPQFMPIPSDGVHPDDPDGVYANVTPGHHLQLIYKNAWRGLEPVFAQLPRSLVLGFHEVRFLEVERPKDGVDAHWHGAFVSVKFRYVGEDE